MNQQTLNRCVKRGVVHALRWRGQQWYNRGQLAVCLRLWNLANKIEHTIKMVTQREVA
jgi:hypothetical protein